jgi:membrane-associated PAP2 superfamily phosphatase
MLFGLVLTMTQVARGAHFFSHQVWTALICWYASLAAYWLFFSFRRSKNIRSGHCANMAPGSLQLRD